METTVRAYCPADLSAMREIWNAVVEDGLYFPQTEPLSEQEAAAFFKEQSFCGVAEREGEVIGLYTIGRCGHIANASYAVKASARGNHVGGRRWCATASPPGGSWAFCILQQNDVVKTNYGAIHLYEKLGFVPLGTIPGGFRQKDDRGDRYEDIVLFCHTL